MHRAQAFLVKCILNCYNRRRLVGLLGYELSSLAPSVALSLLHNRALTTRPDLLTAQQLAVLLTPYDIKVGSPLATGTVLFVC
jgi:hypothetical protein